MLGEANRARSGTGAERRITRSRDFERLLREGKRTSASGYTFYFAPRPAGPARLGILVSRKHSPKATRRNAIKRCIREAFRLEHARLGTLDILVRPPYGAVPGKQMLMRLRQLLERVEQ